MRIGLDARTAVGEAGIAQYGKNIIAALKAADRDDEFVIFGSSARKIPLWTEHVVARSRFNRAKLDLLHVLGAAPPLGYGRPYVMTVHDLAIYRHPEWFPKGQWFSTRVSFPLAAKNARRIITPSNATKQDLVEILGVDEKKIAVIPHGVSAPLLLDAEGAGTRRILFLGTIEPRKNIVSLVRAYRLMIDGHRELNDVGLVIAGSIGWRAAPTIDEINKARCEGYKIEMIGPVSGEDKWKLLAQSACLAFPSHYEGFGLPALEAMAAGTPVVCSDSSSLPEVVGDAALTVAPNDIDALAAALARVLTDKKTAVEMRTRGLSRASGMSWEKAARETIEVYGSISV